MTWRLYDCEARETQPLELRDGRVASVLARFDGRPPFIAEVYSDASPYKLTIGIARDHGFVQHSRRDGAPPYLVATRGDHPGDAVTEFLIDRMPTEIPAHYTVSRADVVAIISHFIATSERSAAFTWASL